MDRIKLVNWCFLGFCLTACTKGDAPVTDTGIGLWPEAGCGVDDDSFGKVYAEATEVSTVPRVHWRLGDDAGVSVVFAPLDELDAPTTAPASASEDDSTLLLGLPADTRAIYRLVAERDSGLTCSLPREAWTEPLPPSLPALDTVLHDPTGSPLAYGVTAIHQREGSWVVIFDGRGRIVWSWFAEAMAVRARLAVDGRSVMVDGIPVPGHGNGITRIALDGSSTEATAIDALSVDWVELSAGSYAGIVHQTRSFDHEGEQRTIRGQALMEVTRDGEATQLWSVFDLHEPDLDQRWEEIEESDGLAAEDWSHINGLSYHPDSGAYYMTSEGFDSVIAVDVTTGETLWELAAGPSDWSSPEGPLVASPHSVQRLDGDRLLVFNRWHTSSTSSEALEIALDFASGEATPAWLGQADNQPSVYWLGNAERLHSGETLVSWSSAGQIDLLDGDNTSLLRLSLDQDQTFGFVTIVPSLY